MVKQYEKLVYSICYRVTGNRFDAEDLTQETFLAAYRNLSRFDRTNEKAWLGRIASNKTLDYLKSSKRKTFPEEDSQFEQLQDPGPGPEESYLERESIRHVRQLCEQLKSPYREIALEHFYKEKKAAQIAEETGVNLKTVQTQIYRARSMLKKLVEQERKGGKRNGIRSK
ncbi:MAG: RNA polymerase sigma factor [Lachnospiraceae bacterium]